jgi:hypothetical protein
VLFSLELRTVATVIWGTQSTISLALCLVKKLSFIQLGGYCGVERTLPAFLSLPTAVVTTVVTAIVVIFVVVSAEHDALLVSIDV